LGAKVEHESVKMRLKSGSDDSSNQNACSR
jgi:hypothetical protein